MYQLYTSKDNSIQTVILFTSEHNSATYCLCTQIFIIHINHKQNIYKSLIFFIQLFININREKKFNDKKLYCILSIPSHNHNRKSKKELAEETENKEKYFAEIWCEKSFDICNLLCSRRRNKITTHLFSTFSTQLQHGKNHKRSVWQTIKRKTLGRPPAKWNSYLLR